VQKELPEQSQRFVTIDEKVREILADGYKTQLAKDFCNQEYVNPALEKVEKDLAICEKAL